MPIMNLQSTFLRFLKNSTTALRHYNTNMRNFEEVRIPVDEGYIAGKWYGPQNEKPILTLHGWQDNCGSFDTLIPLLPKHISFLTIDLPGHGRSSHFQPGCFYKFMDYAILVRRLQLHFGWQKMSLMGHSLGAISSYLFALIYPDLVDYLVLFDGLRPLHNRKIIERRGIVIDDLIKYDELRLDTENQPRYTMDALKQMLHKGTNKSIDLDKCDYLLRRNTVPTKEDPTKYLLTRDLRLKVGPTRNFPEDEVLENTKKITMPVCIVVADKVYVPGQEKYFYDTLDVLKTTSSDLQYAQVKGTHHVHLNNPERVAPIVNEFLNKHHVAENYSYRVEGKL